MAKVTGSLKHTHQYFKRDDGRWACMLDGCTHFMPRNMSPAPAGRMSLCWSCNEEFLLTPANMQNARPKCDACEDSDTRLSSIIDSMMKGNKS